MHKLTHNNWAISIFLFALAILTVELDRVVPMSDTMHHLDLVLAIILFLMAGTVYIYQYAQENRDENAWWELASSPQSLTRVARRGIPDYHH